MATEFDRLRIFHQSSEYVLLANTNVQADGPGGCDYQVSLCLSLLGLECFVADCLERYIPDGNFKFGAVEIKTPELSEQSMLHYRLFVDGEEVWTHTIPAPPVAGHGLFEAGR